ncbi:uncharacterized protein K489DRAFT_409577 [Dissoconium aciculare CBS 342.82]|uniref:Uncharacterized protein n=1 Tax=Dissoconium aciculare CBS 342.82 TaxID=1314786 RepID=A0A6J3MAC8_9PEZI|nr:uncharacterized protein K489DRAFT_409577 [Dissoconium aciculare CBS 342.82]KAF1823772.1 hypothetical protein K489DRAFT_409577 [Dissoconium aciculare CBS 342.82]
MSSSSQTYTMSSRSAGPLPSPASSPRPTYFATLPSQANNMNAAQLQQQQQQMRQQQQQQEQQYQMLQQQQQQQQQMQQQQQQQRQQPHMTAAYIGQRGHNGGVPNTAQYLQDFSLLAEAAKRAEMACLARDLGDCGL